MQARPYELPSSTRSSPDMHMERPLAKEYKGGGAQLDLAASNCLVVEDSLAGIAAAKRAWNARCWCAQHICSR